LSGADERSKAQLHDSTGPSGRIGLKTKWTIATASGQVWQPYLRGNLWRDWGAEANAVYFANVDYEFAVGAAENEKRNGVRGAFGARYTW
jgi:outer membrane autotransporter protein